MDVNSDFDRSRWQQSGSLSIPKEISTSRSISSSNSGIFQLRPGINYAAPPASPPIVRGQIDPNSFYGIYLGIMMMPRYNRDDKLQRQQQRDAFEKLMELELNIASAGLETTSLESKLGNCRRLQEVNIPVGIRNVSSLIYRQPQNSILFRWLFCSINSSYLTVNKVSEVKYDWHIDVYELQQVMKAINLISEKGYYGQVWNIAIRGLEKLAYIKTSKTPEEDTIRHEFFIGYYLNELRDSIPNFMYVYGMFSCKNQEPGNSCFSVPRLQNDNNTEYIPANYLIMESVKPGYPPIFVTIIDYNFEQFMSVYLQIIASIGMAYEKYDFSHNDLHEGNVLLQDLPNKEPVLIPYRFGESRFYIKSYVIVKIIDYGLAHIKIKDDQQHQMNFGNMISPKVDFTRSTPIQDIYLITGRLLRSLKESKRGLLYHVHNIITDFVEFNRYDSLGGFGFNERSFLNQLEAVDFLNFAGPFGKANLSPFNYHLTHILERYPYLRNSVFFDNPVMGVKMLTCGKNNHCASVNDINSAALSNQLI